MTTTTLKPAKRPPGYGYRYPIFCGLVVGGMLGGITQSFVMFGLFGGIAWAYFFFDFFHRLPAGGTPCELDTDDDYKPGFYNSQVEAASHGCMFGVGQNDGPGFYH